MTPTDIPPEVFRDAGHRLIDWVADYLANPEQYPVLAQVAPGDVKGALPPAPPRTSESLDDIIADFERVIVPGVTHWNHPGFHAYFSVSASAPGILGELLTAALNTNGMLWRSNPSSTELEQLTLDWLRQMLGMGQGWFGMITDTASLSTMLALAAAREAKPELAVRERGLAGRADLPPLRVYCSEQAHSSVDKGALTLGFGYENVVHVPVDDAFRMRADALDAAVRADRARGMLPLACVATVGTTGTTSIDPVPAIADVCRREGIWLHVDGAYGAAAAAVPEMRHVLDGVERADSLVVNPHKWLFTPIDCSALYTRHPEVLRRAFSLVPEYLTTRGEADEVVNYMDYGVQLGRRFRALKLWMVLRAFGVDGIAERIRAHVALARELAGRVEASGDWELMAPVPLSLVCFRYAPEDVPEDELNILNERILHDVNASGRAFLSHTKLRGKYTIRLAIGNIRTERRHVEEAWRLLQDAASRVLPERTSPPSPAAGAAGASPVRG
ncbi:MAG TPA: pyridoxal-dependent decarboxylase [Gemmatimonadaceae bacterium]|nr:pyridoxal-dependent decarboxylase [Gemmatimonadaceae bacterium]